MRPLSAAAHGSAYLLTQRSWTSRIGTVFRKCSFSRPRRLVDDQARPLEHLEVLHDPEPGHLEALLELAQGLPVALEERVEQLAASRIGERLEHIVHGSSIGD